MTGRLVGYIRVSTVTQTHDQQRDALTAVGVQPRDIFAEKISGARTDRPEFDRMLAYVEKGDTIVVSSFDRFGRNTAQVFSTIQNLLDQGIHVRGLRETVDTSTATGRMVAGLFIVIAEYERTLIAERTAAARAAAEARGVHGGRPFKLSVEKMEQAAILLAATKVVDGDAVKRYTVAEVAKATGCSRTTLYRYLKASRVVLQEAA